MDILILALQLGRQFAKLVLQSTQGTAQHLLHILVDAVSFLQTTVGPLDDISVINSFFIAFAHLMCASVRVLALITAPVTMQVTLHGIDGELGWLADTQR